MSKAVPPRPPAASFTPVTTPPVVTADSQSQPTQSGRSKSTDPMRTSQGTAAPRKPNTTLPSLPLHVASPDPQVVAADVRGQTHGRLMGTYPGGTGPAIAVASKLLNLQGKL